MRSWHTPDGRARARRNVKQTLLRTARDWTPPIVSRALRNVLPFGTRFRGHFGTWRQAVDASTGYATDQVFERVKAAALKVKAGEAAYERDSVLFDEVRYSGLLLAGLLRAAAWNDNRLCVLDFGGALGSSYYQNRPFLSGLKDLRWCVVEQERFVVTGRESFADEQLGFYHDVEECLGQEGPDVALFSSVLAYLEDPYEVLAAVGRHGLQTVIVDRTYFHDGREDRLAIQTVPSRIYKADYPAWIFSTDKFLDFMEGVGYRSLGDFESFDKANSRMDYRGYVFDRS